MINHVHLLSRALRTNSFSHLTGFRVNSKVSGLSNVIVYVTAFMRLADKIRHERLDFDTPPYTLKNVYLFLRILLEKSIILRNL